jgi:hypothetical protein
MLTLHVEHNKGYNKATEVLRFITIHNSLAPLRVLNPFVVCLIGKATGKLWWDGDEQPGLDADGNLL